MKKIFALSICYLLMTRLIAQPKYAAYPVYNGTDLGLTYSKSAAVFRIWSPVATAAELLLYKEGDGGIAFRKADMLRSNGGTWVASITGDMAGTFYTFRVKNNGEWSSEVPDPYARAVGINGRRAMVIDLKTTNPAGWEDDASPSFSKANAATDAVIYELHIRDASIDESSGIQHKGKFLGLAETGTKNAAGMATGLDHLKELGVTHVHLLPFFDYNSVDESKPEKPQYNWGYDPLNYNVPEGSYSTNAADGVTRIRELKTMIAAFHKNGLRLVMDVVYNHVADGGTSNFNQLVPGYYFRQNANGGFSNATACGNETASERPMMRKFMLESVLYWAKEYHIDGFRFDLMGVHDIETMNLISAGLHKINPSILLYGEGWTAGDSPLPDSLRALKKNAAQLKNIAVFSDDIRDGIKGSVFDIKDRGFASGKAGMEPSIQFGITAATNHPQVDLLKVNYSKAAYSAAPWNVVNYCDCHDNNILWDKLLLSCPEATTEELIKMQKLALTIVLTSQGIPFLHAGTEFLRTKTGVENSFNAGDSINHIDWTLKNSNKDTYDYVSALIRLRKAHPAFRMTTSRQVKSNISFDEKAPPGTVVYTINGAAVKDKWKQILIAFNGTKEDKNITLPPGNWKRALNSAGNGDDYGLLKKYSSVILYQE